MGRTSDEIADELLELVDALGRLVDGHRRAGGLEEGLQPIHLRALAYLGRANRYSNTPAALAEWLGQTKGTVSQSLLLLEARGLVVKTPDAGDGRVVRLALAARGRALLARLERDADWAGAAGDLAGEEAARAADALRGLLAGLQRRRGHQTFGVCKTCRHFRSEAGGGMRCGLTGDVLRARDVVKLCREHAAPEAAGAPPA